MAYGDDWIEMDGGGHGYIDSDGNLCPYSSGGDGGPLTPGEVALSVGSIIGILAVLPIIFLFSYLSSLYSRFIEPNEDLIVQILLASAVIIAIIILAVVLIIRYIKKNPYLERKKAKFLTATVVALNALTLCGTIFIALAFGERVNTNHTISVIENVCVILILVFAIIPCIAAIKTRSAFLHGFALANSALTAFSYIPGYTEKNPQTLTYVFLFAGLACMILNIVLLIRKRSKKSKYAAIIAKLAGEGIAVSSSAPRRHNPAFSFLGNMFSAIGNFFREHIITVSAVAAILLSLASWIICIISINVTAGGNPSGELIGVMMAALASVIFSIVSLVKKVKKGDEAKKLNIIAGVLGVVVLVLSITTFF